MSNPIETACPSCGAMNRFPRTRLHEQPSCGRCKQKLFPESPVTVTDASWKQQVEDCPLPVLVDFWAPWCGPCRAVAPTLQQLAQERAGKLKIVKVNVDENQRLAARFQIRSIPALVLMRDGTQLDMQLGALPKRQLESWLDRVT